MFLDYIVKKLNSFGFRILIILLGLIILISSLQNYFNTLEYTIAILGYLILSFYLVSVDAKNFAYLRLLLDYTFIGIVLYQKNIIEFNSVIFLLLPIFNSPNSTKNYRKIIFPLSLTLIILIINQQFHYLYLFSLSILIIMSYIFYKRITFYSAYSGLYEQIDQQYINNINFSNIYQLLESFIKKFNSNSWVKFFGNIKLDNIYCFQLKKNALHIRTGSTFVWHYNVENLMNNLKKFDKGDIQHDITITLDNIDYTHNSIIKLSLYENYYYLIIVWKGNFFTPFREVVVTKVLKPYFSKIIKLMILDQTIKVEKRAQIKNFKKSQSYINNAKLALHFLRNKLSPIDNLFQMLEELNTATDREKEILLYELDNEFTRAKRSLQSITQKTSLFLDKSEDPFYANKIVLLKARRLFVLLRDSWEEVFSESDIDVNLFDEKQNNCVRVDVNCMAIVFHELVSNIEKYHQGYKRLFFDYNKTEIIVTFKNSISNDRIIIDELNKIITDISTKERNEIVKRRAYGLMNIISFLNQMEIKFEFTIDDQESMFNVKLFFRRAKDDGHSHI